MKILTAAEMRAADRLTSERYGVPSTDLMENAGSAVAHFVLREFPHRRRVTILCGRGNNGGDGMVAARKLIQAGCACTVLILGDPAEIHGDAQVMLDRLSPAPIGILREEDLDLHSERFAQTELFLDAVLGTGFRPPLRGLAEAGRRLLDHYPRTPVISIDLPSGWDADARTFSFPGVYRSDAVVTFTAPKPAHVFGMLTVGGELTRPGNVQQGPIVVAGIGSPPEAIPSSAGLVWAGSAKCIADRPRNPDSNKGKFGHVVIVAGSRGKTGAAAMASQAALRAGAGLVTAAVPECILPTVAGSCLELMTIPLAEGVHGEIASRNLEEERLQSILEKKTVLAVGPGMGQEPESVEFFFGLLGKAEIPMVIDADGLNALATKVAKLDGRGRTVVLTPHPGEMSRLVGRSIAEVQANREEIAQEFARRHSVTLVLKGWRTLIARPDGGLAVNTTGNPGLAKGGSGDILTGIIAAMLSQYPETPGEAVEAAVYLHGLAADFAVAEADQHTLLATDLLQRLAQAFRFRPLDTAGYTWIAGLPGSLRTGA